MVLCVIMTPESQPAQAAFQECTLEMCLVSLLTEQRTSLGNFVSVKECSLLKAQHCLSLFHS